MSIWLQVPAALVALGAVLGGLAKAMRVAYRVDAALPTLLKIADEFKPNGGNSLKDNINRLNDTLTEHTATDERRFQELADIIKSESEQTRTNTTARTQMLKETTEKVSSVIQEQSTRVE